METTYAQDINIFSPFDVEFGNTQFNWEEFLEKYYASPKSVRDIIFNTATTVFLKEQIAVRYALSLDQSQALSRAVRDVLLANFYWGDLAVKLAEQLKINEGQAKEITAALIEKLFSPALEDIEKMQKEKFKKSLLESSRQPNPSLPAATPASPLANPYNILDLRAKNNDRQDLL